MKKLITIKALLLIAVLTIISVTRSNAQTYEIKGHGDFHAKNVKENGINNITFRNMDYTDVLVTDDLILTEKQANLFMDVLSKYHAPNESFVLQTENKRIEISYHADKGRHYRKIVVYSENKRSQLPHLTDRQFKKLLGLS